jgi:hypothetical protein
VVRCFFQYVTHRSYGRGSSVLSYTAQFRHEVVGCLEEKGNRKAAAVSGVDENGVRLRWKLKAVIIECEASRKKIRDPRKGDFLKLMMQPSHFSGDRHTRLE